MPKVSKDEEQWRAEMAPERYEVLRGKGTEPAWSGELNTNKQAGTYRCGACGAELFSSETKFDSGSGWPSFYAPAGEESVQTEPDNSLFTRRTEVLCASCESHLGHVFDDGPQPSGQRYCINSLALRFDPERPGANAQPADPESSPDTRGPGER